MPAPTPPHDPPLPGERQRPPALDSLSEEDFEDFLTAAIGLYAEQTGITVDRLRTFAEAKLLLRNRGLVVELENAEFRVSIVKTR